MTGILLINLGTPEAPTTRAVRRYLRQFLSDPRIIDIHPVGRFLLLHLIILPFRPKRSAAAYRAIWTERGSPLLFHSLDLAREVRARLGQDFCVELGMRYGDPSIPAAAEALCRAGARRIVVFPLFPQYAASSTGSALEEALTYLAQSWNVPATTTVAPFYDDPGFIAALAAIGAPVLAAANADKVLFSFHGIPQRHVRKSDPSRSHCLQSPECCQQIRPVNRDCYRAQSFATARLLAARLGLRSDQWTVAFQSRLGRTPWIPPYTDHVIDDLARQGVRRLAVFCPAFVADCLETLEEIGIRARQQFVAAGGEELVLVPCLNSSAAWADAAVHLAMGALDSRAKSEHEAA